MKEIWQLRILLLRIFLINNFRLDKQRLNNIYEETEFVEKLCEILQS